jgi:hypothetical protein
MNWKTMRYVRILLTALGFIVVSTFNSCDSFLDIPQPVSKIPAELIFRDVDMATTAVIGMYVDLYSGTGFAGGSQSTVVLAGLSADELRNNVNKPDYLQFQNNSINPSEPTVENFWSSMYKSIYEANAIIEGLEASGALPETLKHQLKGEALVVRSFCYFYLANFFGKVPLAISTNYKVNNELSRAEIGDVSFRIISDLTLAEELLTDNYEGSDRSRANKATASSLLARAYLYSGDWARAEDKATRVISNNSMYDLSSLNNVFLSSSREAIWQLKPDAAGSTFEAYFFGLTNGPYNNVLVDNVMSAFEPGDSRKASWTASLTSGGKTTFLPYKYKRESISSTLPNEFSVIIRLSELYLIRAEARMRQGKLALAVGDLDKIRQRAELPLIHDTNPGIGTDELMRAIEQERRIELFAEWGHRWLDLKRWNRSSAVLGYKLGWTNDDLLYPIPAAELRKNSKLLPQNPGY